MRESPVRPKLSRQVGGRPRRQTRQRVSEAGEGKGAGSVLSPEMGIVVVTGINPGKPGGKPTLSDERKAAVLRALWPANRTPPGSETGACVHGGGPGTWESRLSPCGERKGMRKSGREAKSRHHGGGPASAVSLRKRRHKRQRRAKRGIGEGQRKSNDPETDWRQS